MSDGFPYTYFKVAPFGFDQTVYDTDDLSITRGASLTLLALPALLQTDLAAQLPDITFDWIQFSASELVFRATRADAEARTLTLTPEAGGQERWRRTLSEFAGRHAEQVSDESLRTLARQALNNAGLFPEPALLEMTGRQLLSMLSQAQLAHGQDAWVLTDDQCDLVLKAITKYTADPHAGWPFELMLFNTACFVPRPSSPDLSPKDAIAALDTRLGLARFSRMGCIVPKAAKLGNLSADKAVCQFTGIYAAGSVPEKKRPTSPNAQRRRKAGRDGKQQFYQDILEGAEAAAKVHDFGDNAHVTAALVAIGEAKGKVTNFAEDFSDIVKKPPDTLPLSLKSNLCVLNMDGNGFGALRGGAGDIDAYRRFSAYLDILKAGMLARILGWIVNADNGMLVGNVARFETLLWGGDEFTFVLPAWKGWELATVIHDAVKDWQTLDGTAMTFATGLAFGPHNAPIRDLKAAAEDLTEMAKSDREHAVWQAIAYESVDRVHFSPEHYRVDWLGLTVENKHFNLRATDAVALPETVREILVATSRSALHKLYDEYKGDLACHQTDTTQISKQIDRIAPAMREAKLKSAKAALLTTGDYPLLRFAQINLLLDYILPNAGRA